MSRKQENLPKEENKAKDFMPLGAETVTAPDTTSLLEKIEETLGKTRVTYGSNDNEFDSLAGKTVASVRKALSTPYNLPEGAMALVKGEQVSEDYVLTQQDQLEFVKNSGSKGQ